MVLSVLACKGIRMLRSMTDEQLAVAYAEYSLGMPMSQLTRKNGCSKNCFYNGFRRLGLPIRGEGIVRKYDLNHNAFENAHLNPEAAYWAGMLAADGHVPRSYVRLGLNAGDSEEIDLFAKFVGYDGKPEESKEKVHLFCGNKVNAGRQRRVSVFSPKMASDLHRYGIISPKTKFLKIVGGLEDSLDFWRGAICGDGWISITQRGDVEIGIGGCLSFVEQYCSFVEKNCSVKSDVRKFKSNGPMPFYRVRHGAMNCCKIVSLLFAGDGHALARKKAIAQEIIASVVSDGEYVIRGKSRVAHRDWSEVTRDELIEVRTRLGSWRAVADYYGANFSTFQRIIYTRKVGNLFREKYGWLTKELLIQKYLECKNWSKIADDFGITVKAIYYQIEKHGLKSLDFLHSSSDI